MILFKITNNKDYTHIKNSTKKIISKKKKKMIQMYKKKYNKLIKFQKINPVFILLIYIYLVIPLKYILTHQTDKI